MEETDDLENFDPGPQEPAIAWAREYFPDLFVVTHAKVVLAMDKILELAVGYEPDSHMARQFIGHVAPNYICSENAEAKYLATMASQALVRVSSDKSIRQDVFPSIASGLVTPNIPGDTSLIFLDAFESFVHDSEWRDDNRGLVGELLLRAITTEFSRLRGERDERYQMRLLFLMRLSGGHDAAPLLDAIADAHDNDEIRQLAKQTSRYVVDALERVWNDTREDQVSMAENRGRRLDEASGMNFNEAEIVQCIFSQMKGLPVDGASDPRVPGLAKWMTDAAPKVRLAAAFAMAMSCSVSEMFDDLETSIQILSRFAVSCDKPTDVNDALLAMNRLADQSPVAESSIAMAKEHASREFVFRNSEV